MGLSLVGKVVLAARCARLSLGGWRSDTGMGFSFHLISPTCQPQCQDQDVPGASCQSAVQPLIWCIWPAEPQTCGSGDGPSLTLPASAAEAGQPQRRLLVMLIEGPLCGQIAKGGHCNQDLMQPTEVLMERVCK